MDYPGFPRATACCGACRTDLRSHKSRYVINSIPFSRMHSRNSGSVSQRNSSCRCRRIGSVSENPSSGIPGWHASSNVPAGKLWNARRQASSSSRRFRLCCDKKISGCRASRIFETPSTAAVFGSSHQYSPNHSSLAWPSDAVVRGPDCAFRRRHAGIPRRDSARLNGLTAAG